jgi:hypothetical protein
MSSERKADKLSRRRAIQTSAGLVAAPILATGAAADEPSKSELRDESELRDPAELYPKPPFPRQHQDPPGLASKMIPVPDHG